ncbi:MAG: TVP38/TMEM64 family protein, partial [Planctomycetota bacterium]
LRSSSTGRLITAAAVVGLLVVDILLPIPSSIVMALSGKLLGCLLGGTVAFVGAMAAALIGFFACRWGGHRVFDRLVGEADSTRVRVWFERWGVYAIVISRPVPMLTEILSCLAGLSSVPPRTFCLASLLGTLPVAFVYGYVGSRGSIADPLPAILVSLLVPAAGWFVTRRIKKAD